MLHNPTIHSSQGATTAAEERAEGEIKVAGKQCRNCSLETAGPGAQDVSNRAGRMYQQITACVAKAGWRTPQVRGITP